MVNPCIFEGFFLTCYALLGIACLISVVYSIAENDKTRFKLQQAFHGFLALFIAVRIAWTVETENFSTDVTYVLNRMGFSLFFTTFTLVLFYWAELYHKKYVTTSELLPQLFWIFIGTNIIQYAFTFVLMALYLAEDSRREGDPLYDASIYVVVAMSVFISAGFLVYGARLLMRSRISEDTEDRANNLEEIMKILSCTVIFSICFFVRSVAFLYRPFTGRFMNLYAFRMLGYFIPEIIPSVVQFYMIWTRKRKEEYGQLFIDQLYKEEEQIYVDEHKPMINLDEHTTYHNYKTV